MFDNAARHLLSLVFTGPQQSTIRVRGSLTSDTAGAFTTALFAGGVRPGASVVLDLSGVTRIDSYGAQALQICERSLEEQGSAMIVQR
jgi:anti-anti-sigma regulatory factor